MSRVLFKGGALMAPLPPALITCGTMENPNVMTAAWTGIINTRPPKTYVSIRPERYSYGLIKETGELVINLTTESLVRTADFCGVRSGRDLNKFEKCGITPIPSTAVSAPTLAESPLSIECKVFEVMELGSHHMFLLDVVAVTADERLMDKNGRLCLEKSGLAAYAHGEYFALGKKLGDFGFSVRKKKKHPQKPRPQKKNDGEG
ncbi:MAG: flavin reductase family protein [Clostridia bacterium]|nr:flavin reductase family protein [Clostridia bacterium]